MGNVLAASKPPPPLFDSKVDIPEPVPSASLSTKETAASGEDTVNPGTIEDLHKKCKDVMPVPFEGAKMMLNKGLSNHFQVSHTLNLCSTSPSGYRFGATYVGTKQFTPNEAYPVLLGDIDPSGNLNANLIHQFSPQLRLKFASQIQQSKVTAAQLTTDYRGKDFTASLTVVNPNIITNSGVVVAHYLQSVSEKCALGGEIAYQYGPNVPGGKVAVVSAAGRYGDEKSTWSGTVGAGGVHICYYQKASEQLQVGVEFETSFRLQESVASVGYQVDLPKADLVFRGMVDSNWNVSGVLEKRLQPLPFSFALSGRLNHVGVTNLVFIQFYLF
ncbi:mitochondrial import receptor subunit TOM40 homolog 1-like [Hermetia illucens]|uniref:mitochondrial import receptor subunit TOM40 homolog 1-like n=1 Tax=Hermetia illucens TaxID=343691 RepID=UPI0018CC6061|nr:mitochondrial import receptor subunit TOM40 homolog 1-like [Hermetia illucens]